MTMDLAAGARSHPLSPRGSQALQYSRQDRATSMVRAGVARWRIAMPGPNHLNLHFLGAGHGCVEIIDLKPNEDAVSTCQILVADFTVIVFHIPAVQLQNQSRVRNKAVVLGTVHTLTAK
jgi:hypothetical protein